MKAVAKFEKVSFEQFKKDFADFNMSDEDICKIYENIKLPHRATVYSAGYDIYSTLNFTLKPGETIKIPTGIRCRINEDYALFIFPRSGLGFKYRLQLNNTVGVVDSDYYGADNEGHIFVKITNDSNENKTVDIKEGDAFSQGIFLQYGVTEDDDASGIRSGGLGSTSK
ncbi:MAG: deoxyuridine 5'-triphosphate nucleotidohydrolase [Lachnospiraceae bacterium]|nr:deoxyuridine 5'-triphosphate nucleotidohydrolase [Lachnospiraceae bacterium]